MALGKYNVTFATEADLSADGSDFDGIASGEIGIFNVDSGAYLSAAEAFLRSDFAAAAAIADTTSAGAVVQALAPAIVPQRFQIVQGRDIGNPWCTPIINSEDVQEISFRGTTAAVAASSSVDLSGASIAVGENVNYKFVITGLDTSYEAFVNPSDDERPSYVGQVINFERTATSATLDTEQAALVVAFNAIENMPFTASYTSGTDVLVFTCDVEGVGFVMKADFSGVTTAPTVATVTDTAFVRGSGDGKYILGQEKKSQGFWGYHNRLYLPQSPKLYADSSANYDMITLTWNQAARPGSNANMFTGNNIVNIAVKDGSTNTNFDAAFGINLDGATSQTVIYGKYNA